MSLSVRLLYLHRSPQIKPWTSKYRGYASESRVGLRKVLVANRGKIKLSFSK